MSNMSDFDTPAISGKPTALASKSRAAAKVHEQVDSGDEADGEDDGSPST